MKEGPIFSSGNKSKSGGAILAGIVVLAVLMRLSQYWGDRSLWLDEASLALNFLDADFHRVLQPLDYRQAAPVGFNLLTVLILRIAGISEWSLRFLPLVGGLLSILVFMRLSQRMLSGPGLLFANYTFAISRMLVYFSNEFKPYILDLLLSLVICAGLLAWWEEGRSRARLPWLVVIGCLAVWFSFPIVFVMAGVGGVMMVASLREKKPADFWALAAVTGAWLISFAFQYEYFGRNVSKMGTMHEFWGEAGAFMPLPPWKGEGLAWYATNFLGYFRDAVGLSGSTYILPFIATAGIVSLIRRQAWVRLGALVTPLLLVLLASGLEVYPFQGRLILFTAPFALLVCGEGIALLLDLIRPPALGYALVGLLLLLPTAYSLPHLFQPRKVEEVRPLAQYLQREAKSDDFVVVFKDSPAYQYYAARLGIKQTQIPLMPSDYFLTPDDYASTLPRIAELLRSGRHGWLIISHAEVAQQKEVLARLPAICQVRPIKQQPGAQLFALDPL